jgi:hypothetical protein
MAFPPTVTDGVLVMPILREWTDYMQAEFEGPSGFGTKFDFSVQGYTGIEARIFGTTLVYLGDTIEAVADNWDATKATDQRLDAVAAAHHTRRKQATKSKIPMRIEGTPGTDLGGRRYRYRPNQSLWEAPVSTTIGSNGVVLFTIDAVDAGPVIAAEAPSTSWDPIDVTTDVTIVESVGELSTGTLRETNSELQARLTDPSTGKGTQPADRQAVRELDGVSFATTLHNRSNAYHPVTGNPPRSIEFIVDGGDRLDIATAIYNTYGGSAELVGNTSVTAVFDPLEGEETILYSAILRREVIIAIELVRPATPETDMPEDAVERARSSAGAFVNGLDRGINVDPEEIRAVVRAAFPAGSLADVVVEVGLFGGALTGDVLVIDVRERAVVTTGSRPARITGTEIETFNLTAGDTINLSINGGTLLIGTIVTGDFETISAAEASEVAGVLDDLVAPKNARAGVGAGSVVLETNGFGSDTSISILPTSSADLLTALGLSVGEVFGSDSDITVEITEL